MTEIGVGTTTGGVRLDALIARSVSSVVYRGTELASGDQVAVKVVHPPSFSAIRRMAREARLLKEIDHPAVVSFHSMHVENDMVVLITTWVDGVPLRNHVPSNTHVSAERAAVILAELATPLDHLHRSGIVHRDITPNNVIVRPDNSLCLIDLGLGHAVDTSTLTNQDLVAGTPQYLAPEIIRGESASPQSDQYSVAVIIHELIAGASPFPSGESVATALHHHVNTSPVPLDEIETQVPPALADAVVRALDKDPRQRFASMAEFTAAATAAPEERSARVPGRRRMVAALSAVAVVAVVALAGVAISRSNSPEPALDEVQGLSVASSQDDGLADQAATPTEPTAPTQAAPTQPAAPTQAPTQPAAPTQTATQPAAPTQTATDDLGADLGTAAVTTAWTAGLAAELACNALAGSDFSNGSVPLDYFGDPPGRERVVTQGGFGDTWALEVGTPDNFGQYAEIVPVTPGVTYWFRGYFERSGAVEAAEMGISLLDAEYQGLDISVKAEVASVGPGFFEVELSSLPTDAAFALPYLFKDSSPGVLVADELVFGSTSACYAEITAEG